MKLRRRSYRVVLSKMSKANLIRMLEERERLHDTLYRLTVDLTTHLRWLLERRESADGWTAADTVKIEHCRQIVTI